MDYLNEVEVCVKDFFKNIDWFYEFLVLKYYDFICEEFEVVILVVERWFDIVIFCEVFCMCLCFFY